MCQKGKAIKNDNSDEFFTPNERKVFFFLFYYYVTDLDDMKQKFYHLSNKTESKFFPNKKTYFPPNLSNKNSSVRSSKSRISNSLPTPDSFARLFLLPAYIICNSGLHPKGKKLQLQKNLPKNRYSAKK